MNYKTRILLASPHRYLDLARLWYRFVRRELLPAFARLGLNLEVKIFCDANASEFEPALFPGVQFSKPEPGLRDFMDFYDVALHENCDYLFFADADVFFLNGEWVSSYFPGF